MPESLIFPQRTLLVLCGPAGSGKSTFAARHFPETAIVSSDRCRAMICDDANNQAVTRDAFDLFHYILQKRMALGRLCVADSVALRAYARENLRVLSRRFGYFGCLLIFPTTPEICIERDRQRERRVGESVVRYHSDLLARTLQEVSHEGWERIHVLTGEEPDIRFED